MSLGREVALKFLPADTVADPQARKRLLREAQAASRLNHPNIATIYEVNEWENAPFISMEFVTGQTLKQMRPRGGLAPAQFIGVARQIAEGLQEAHRKGVYHRDIKPSNIMLDSRSQVKILDFGLAAMAWHERAAGETEETYSTGTLTQDSVGGTVPYMSPEQFRGEPAGAAAEEISRRALLCEFKPRQGGRILSRRHDGRHHHGAREDQGAPDFSKVGGPPLSRQPAYRRPD